MPVQQCVVPLLHTIVVLLLLLLPLPAKAQKGPILSPFAGYRYDALPALNRETGRSNIYQGEGTGTIYNHTGIVGIDILSPTPVFFNLQGSFHMGLEFSTGNFTSNPYSSSDAIDPETLLPTSSVNSFSIDASSVSFHLGVRIAAPLTEQVSLFGGMWASWLFSSASIVREHIISPDGTIFSSTGTGERLIIPEQDLLQSPVRYGPVAGLSWLIQPSPELSIRPELSVSLDVRTIPLNRAFGIGAGIAFSYEKSPEALPLDEPMDESIPPPVANVHLFATDTTGMRSDTAQLTLHSVLYRRYLPLLPLLVFGEKDSSIDKYYKILSSVETDAFSIDEVAKGSLAEFYRHTPNIIAQRLHTYPDATLSLLLPSGHKELRSQIKNTRRYFTDIWRIDSTRVKTITKPIKKQTGNNSLTLETSSAAVFTPVVAQWIEEEVATPTIGMEKQMAAAAGISHWQITVKQDTSRIVTFSNIAYEAAQNMSSFPLYGLHFDSLRAPLIAELIVTDSAGYTATASDTLPLFVKTASAIERRTYFLFAPLPGVNHITTLNNALLSHLADFVDNTTVITIDPAAQPDSVWNTTLVGEKLLSLLNKRNIHPVRIDISSPSIISSIPLFREAPPLPAIRITAERRNF